MTYVQLVSMQREKPYTRAIGIRIHRETNKNESERKEVNKREALNKNEENERQEA